MVGRRRCGTRKPGKAYFVIETSSAGMPLDWFIKDPPEPIDVSVMSTQGITVLPRASGYDLDTGKAVYATDKQGRVIHDVYDWVGGDYPNVADFIEEARVQGISRLNPRTSDFGNITKDSQYRLVHGRAIIVDPVPFFKERADTGHKACPKNIPTHMSPGEEWLEYFANTCAGLWWECMEEYDSRDGDQQRIVHRNMANGMKFAGAVPPIGVKPEYEPAIFMYFPIGRMGRWDVIKSDDGAHDDAVKRLRALKDDLFKRTRLLEE